jgi:hypothetical protein
MNKLTELIQHYAPDGVPFVRLGEVCLMSTSNIRWQNTDRNYRYIGLNGHDPIG